MVNGLNGFGQTYNPYMNQGYGMGGYNSSQGEFSIYGGQRGNQPMGNVTKTTAGEVIVKGAATTAVVAGAYEFVARPLAKLFSKGKINLPSLSKFKNLFKKATPDVAQDSVRIVTNKKATGEVIKDTVLANESELRKAELEAMRKDAAAAWGSKVEPETVVRVPKTEKDLRKLQLQERKAAREAAGETNTAKMERIAQEKIDAQKAAFESASREEQLAMMKQDAAVGYGGKIEPETTVRVSKTEKDLRKLQLQERKAAREAAGETNTAKMDRIANEKIQENVVKRAEAEQAEMQQQIEKYTNKGPLTVSIEEMLKESNPKAYEQLMKMRQSA